MTDLPKLIQKEEMMEPQILWQYSPSPDSKGKLKAEEQIIEELQNMHYREITDIDIRKNDGYELKIVKLPWTEWIYGIGFGVVSGLLFYFIYEEYIDGLW